jgi:protein involved in polysaccharide export with SLBB domain
MIFETMIFETMILQTMISPTTTSEKLLSERCRPPADSCEMALRSCHAVPAGQRFRSIAAALFGLLLALPGLGRSQTTLRTPSADDPQCVENNCPSPPGTSDGNSNPNAGSGGNQTPPTDSLPNNAWPDNPRQYNGQQSNAPQSNGQQSNQNQDPNAEPARHPRRDLPPIADAIPEPPPNEFQEFVASSVGRKLPIYGHNLFDHVPTTFAPVDRIPASDDYTIGAGDEILLRVWGQIDLDGKLVVDRSGEVFLPKVGTLSVAGLRYQQLPEYFRTAIGRVFRNFDLTVSLGQLRSIQVFVVGQARRPGTYTVSSLCTLVNALFASGGPSGSGSMRHIELKRNDRLVTEFDFYDLLLKGDKSKDARLLPGDVLYIPPTGPSIAIAGSVNVPAIYELREGTSLGSAIEMAGGLTTTADGQKAVVERIEKHNIRRVEEFSLDGPGLGRALQDGDVVRIFSLSPRFENAVTLRGNVAHPGRVAWHSGMRLRDVIPNQDALVTRDYWRATNSVANTGERGDFQFSRDNERTIDPAANWGEKGGQKVGEKGAEKGNLESESPPESAKAATENTTAKLRHQITRNGPEINWDYAVIQRMNPQDLTTRLLPFDLGKLVLQGDEQNNLALEPGDIITIFSQSDLAVPLEQRSKFVRLEGEFRIAGVYQAEAGETIRHLVARVGGFTANAYPYGAEFTRESVRLDQQKGLDRLIEQLEEDVSRNALALSGLSPDEVADNRAKLEAQRQLIEKLRAVKATGRVVLDLKPDSTGGNDLPEIALEDGDRLVVPFRPATVEMLGAVYNKNSFLYRREERLDDYLRRAGGPTRDADTARMFIIRADGSVLGKQSVKGLWNGGFASVRLMPGDAIVVPERLSHGSILKGLRDWSQVFAQFALGAAAVRIIQ